MATTSPPRPVRPVLDPSSVRRHVLPNGLTVLIRHDDSAPVVAVVTYVKAGYFDETDEVIGIAHVLEHMYFKGTERHAVGEISKATKAAGGYLNAGTIYDHTSYYTVLPSSGFEAGLAVQADAYASSVIDAAELAKELKVIIQEAKRKADNPSAVATETLYELMHDRHRMRRWRIGREEGLRTLTREDVVRFYRNFYRPSNTILSIVGDVNAERAAELVEELYGALPDAPIERTPGPEEPAKRELRVREWEGDIAQTQLAFGWHTPGTLHPDTPALDLAAAVLATGRASRLYRAVRERQLAASVSAYNYTPTERGVFVIHAETPPASTADAARAIWAQLAELRGAGVGLHELQRALNVLDARWVRRLETMEGQANYLAEWEALGDWALGGSYLERLHAATPAHVTEVIRRYLPADGAAALVYRPRGSAEVLGDASRVRAVLEGTPASPLEVSPPRQARPVAARGAAPSFAREEARVRIYRTGAGVPVLIRQRTGIPIVHVGVTVLGGAVHEAAHEAGLTTLLAQSMLKGTAHRTATQVAEDAEMLGGTIGVGVGAESLGWSMAVPTRHLAAALELLADVIERPTVPDDAFETERTVALAGLAMLRDDMYRYPTRLAMQAAFAGHPYGVPASGTEESLATLRAEQAREWHHRAVLGAPAAIAIVGDVEPDEAVALADRAFVRLRDVAAEPLARPAWPGEAKVVTEASQKAQTAISLLFPGPARDDGDRFAADLIAGVASGLGGRFFDELRDRQSLAYTVQAYAAERRLAGVFGAYIATSPDLEETARRGLLAEFAKLRDEVVSDEELERAKTYAIGTYAIRQESGGAVMGQILDAWLFGSLAELEEHDARVRAVTPQDMQRVARRYFDESRRVEGVVRGVGKAV